MTTVDFAWVTLMNGHGQSEPRVVVYWVGHDQLRSAEQRWHVSGFYANRGFKCQVRCAPADSARRHWQRAVEGLIQSICLSHAHLDVGVTIQRSLTVKTGND